MINRDAVAALVDRARREVDEGILPGCQLAVAHGGEVVEVVTLGEAVAGDDTRYVIFSCTKALVASTVWQLLAEGSLQLDDRIADHIPEFGENGKDIVTIEQVLLHTSGFPRAPLGPPGAVRLQPLLGAFELSGMAGWAHGTQHRRRGQGTRLRPLPDRRRTPRSGVRSEGSPAGRPRRRENLKTAQETGRITVQDTLIQGHRRS